MKSIFPVIYGLLIGVAILVYAFITKPNTKHRNAITAEPSVLTEKSTDSGENIKVNTDSTTSSEINTIATLPAEGLKLTKVQLINTESEVIAPDPKAIYGNLSNGMKFILLKNSKPENQASLRLHVNAGSLNEEEDQRGVAHFLEHMVFNGTKNFPDAEKLIPKMQRLGISFGAHANAYTTFDETVYMLDLPNTEEDTLELAFNVMQDFAGGALLEESEIDEERGVISSEKTSRDSVDSRITQKLFKELMPESMIAKRFPIGLEEVIQNAKRGRFTDFYTRFYHPQNMCFVFVGDFDLDEAKNKIIQSFGEYTTPKTTGAKPSVGKLTKGRGFQTAVFTDKEVTETSLSLLTISRKRAEEDTASNRAQKMPLIIASSMLSKRLTNIAVNNIDSTILSGSAYRYVAYKEIEIGGINVVAKNNDWKKALPLLIKEYKRAMEHGFTKSEFKEASANILNSYENRVKSTDSRKSAEIADAILYNYHNNTVYSTAKTDLAIIEDALGSITPEMCHQAFLSFWSTPDIHLTLTTADKMVTPDSKSILSSIFRREITKQTQAPVNEELEQFAYTDLGKPGEITNTAHIPDLQITQLVLSNGIKVNLKKTDYKADSISIFAHIGHGLLTVPKTKNGLKELTSSVMNLGGLGKHSHSDLGKILAGRSVGWDFSIEEDAFLLSGTTNKQDVLTQLQLMTAAIADPGYRQEGERLFRTSLESMYKKHKHSQSGGMQTMSSILSGKDPRFTFPEQQDFEKISTQDVKKWIQPIFQSDPIEITIVGDIDSDALKEMLKTTFATLPKRNTDIPDYFQHRKTPILNLPISEKIFYESKINSAISVIAWRVPRIKTEVKITRRLNVLASILTDRMRVKLREELSIAYSPGAATNVSRVFENKSYLLAYSPCKPEDLEQISTLTLQMANDLALHGANQDELTRALEPIVSTLGETKKTNDYWLYSVMSQMQQKPYKLEWARSRDIDIKSITLEEINKLAKQYLGKDNAAQFAIAPK